MAHQSGRAGRDGRTAQQVDQRSRPLHHDDQLKCDQADSGLRTSERLFWATFDRAVVGIAHTSPEGRWLRFNQQLCDLLGYSREELAARTFQDVTHPDDLIASVACLKRLQAGEQEADELDKRYLRKDGTPIWVHVTISLVRTPEGEPDYFIAMVQDITERKRLEWERARLLEWERAARRDAEAANAQLRALQALTDTALSHLALDELLGELLDRVTGVMGVDHVAILLLDEDGKMLTVRAARGLVWDQHDRVRIPVGPWGFACHIAASRESLIIDDTSALDLHGPHPLLQEQLRSVAGVPLLVEDQAAGHRASRLVGVLAVGSATPRHFTEADVQLLQHAADRIALAIDRARLYAGEQDARRQAEAALVRAQASEAQAAERAERLHTILETIADGVAVYDAEGRTVLVNRAYRELYALERAPAGFEALPARERFRLLHVRDAVTDAPLSFESTYLGRMLRGEVVTGPSVDLRVRAFDGRELELNASMAPLREPDGRLVGAVVVARDLSERNRLASEREAARVQAERQADELDSIFEAAAEGLLVWDAEGRIVRKNAAAHRILGLDAAPPGYCQMTASERLALYPTRDEQDRPVPPEERPIIRALHGELEMAMGTEARELRVRALDGRAIEVIFSTAPLWDRGGHLVGAICVLHDLTERRRLAREREAARTDELAAREASRRLEAFLATAAHDLRAPLTAVVGYLDLAARQTERLAAAVHEEYPALAPSVAAVRQRVGDAGQGAERLTRLLSVLFDTAAIQADRLDLHCAPCDLAALVREQVEALRVAAPGRTIRLHPSNGGAPVLVEADADRIGQVVANYLTNALKYSPPDRPVDVSVEAQRGQARVAVRDTGPGIPEAERAQVWELFHRAPGVATQGGTQSGSLGLGLFICKAIIEAHGGQIGVESAVGAGSTFWFTLPLATGTG